MYNYAKRTILILPKWLKVHLDFAVVLCLLTDEMVSPLITAPTVLHYETVVVLDPAASFSTANSALLKYFVEIQTLLLTGNIALTNR